MHYFGNAATQFSGTGISATFQTKALNICNFTRVSYQISTTNASSLNVAVKLQVKHGPQSNWVDVSGATATITTSTDNVIEISTGCDQVRLVTTFTAGSADFLITAFAKPF